MGHREAIIFRRGRGDPVPFMIPTVVEPEAFGNKQV